MSKNKTETNKADINPTEIVALLRSFDFTKGKRKRRGRKIKIVVSLVKRARPKKRIDHNSFCLTKNQNPASRKSKIKGSCGPSLHQFSRFGAKKRKKAKEKRPVVFEINRETKI